MVSTAYVSLGNGDGTFESSVSFRLWSDTRSIELADLNNDGTLDLAATAWDLVSVLPGRGDGTFDRRRMIQRGNFTGSLATADLNGDGNLDLVAAMVSETMSVLSGKGDLTFQPAQELRVAGSVNSIVIDDWNLDGHMDLAVSTHQDDVSVRFGNGDGTFGEEARHGIGSGIESIGTMDANGDGALDLVMTNRDSASVSVLVGQGDGTFAKQPRYDAGRSPASVVVHDLDRDDVWDLLVANNGWGSTITVLSGRGDGTLGRKQTYELGSQAIAAALSDFNDDGNVDVAIAHATEGAITVLPGKETGGSFSLDEKTEYALATTPTSLIVADVNHDGFGDLVATTGAADDYCWNECAPGGVSILAGQADGTFAPAANYTFPHTGFRSVAAEDFDHDGDLDLVLVGDNGSGVMWNSSQDHVPRPGDGNLDGKFDQLDVVLAFQGGKYLSGAHATWQQGDWNSDGVFDRLDIVAALQTDTYSVGADLYPDVLAAELMETGGGTYSVYVTLSSPYDTPSRYADAWRVLSLEGRILGVRVLAHDHQNEQPFVRSLSDVIIPNDVTAVTVEGRDQISGWGGAKITVPVPR